ncbi:hypothetical protein, unlikely [Trypanosoma congolense IL3000]|uniref:Uncharacterized protein n=1 Tax=Trypanosoma congolense (strain IL3000) TaxID=1068625 RepID=F9WGG5_TRYCI|nr:hypothetical protein, unlikely [Trypanosoma congolense IL3000]
MMEPTQENNPITTPLTMESTVEAVLERARDDWGAMNAWNFFSIYYGNPYGMHRHTAVTMQQYLENPEKFVPDAAKREYIQLNLKLKRSLMQKNFQRDLAKLHEAKVVLLEDWSSYKEAVEIGPMTRMVLSGALIQALLQSPGSILYKRK